MPPSIQLDQRTLLSEAIANDPNFATKYWSKTIKMDARNRNPFKMFIGSEKSGSPICEKTDLSAGGGDTVTFTTTASVKGQGVKGEEMLKDKTSKFRFGTYQLKVGARRFGISWNHLLKYLKMSGTNMTPEQLANTLCSDWWGAMETDDVIQVLLNTAYFETSGRNIMRVNNRASQDDLTLADTLSTAEIEMAQQKMQAQGGKPMSMKTDKFTGAQIPRYLVFTPSKGAYTLDDDAKWREIVGRAGDRGVQNPFFTGEMIPWRNMLVYSCDLVDDTADGRLQSALEPIAYLGKALPSAASTTITGGGAYNDDGTQTDVAIFDYFANFPGFYWSTFEGEVAPADAKTYYAILYNSYDGKYEGISYDAAANDGNTLNGAGAGTVTREVATILGTGNARYSNVHNTATGDVFIIPCTKNGVPLMRSLVLGADALHLAKGTHDAVPIEHGDDFKIVGTQEWTEKSRGIFGIRGYKSPRDTRGRANGFLVIEHTYDVPGVDLVDMS